MLINIGYRPAITNHTAHVCARVWCVGVCREACQPERAHVDTSMQVLPSHVCMGILVLTLIRVLKKRTTL